MAQLVKCWGGGGGNVARSRLIRGTVKDLSSAYYWFNLGKQEHRSRHD